jgi:small subunit ribosomal protein S6
MLKHYETVFIMNPVLADEQLKETVNKFTKIITQNEGKIDFENNWGLRKLAYPIQKKNTGFYYLIQFQAPGNMIAKLEVELKRDERIMRFLTISLDKHSLLYNEKKRKTSVERKKEEVAKESVNESETSS